MESLRQQNTGAVIPPIEAIAHKRSIFFGKFSNISSGRSGEVYKNVSFAALYCTLTQVAVLTRLTLPEVQQLQKARN